MKKLTNALIIIVCLCNFFGCSKPDTTEQTTFPDDTSSHTSVQSNHEEDSTVVEDIVNSYECIRGAAEPVLDSIIYPNAVFKLNADSLTGEETVTLVNGDKLIINNWGCEYFVLTFRFETERFHADIDDAKYWLEKAGLLMKEVEAGLHTPVDDREGTDTLIQHSQANRPYQIGEDITFRGDEIRYFVAVDRVEKLSARKYAIEISYNVGPL